ncbi:MAG: transcriptional repressor NrdR [Chloroflexi bacterium]|nr:MAG: transcriptional repressor NrdR [Chloroflexota bacterium]
MQCPICQSTAGTRVVSTSHVAGCIRRRRECKDCSHRFSTEERVVTSSPLLIKRNGQVEHFDRDKLIYGIQMACAKRPVAPSDIQRLADDIEAAAYQANGDGISSAVVGAMVVNGLKALDEVAYIRYAVMYIGMDRLDNVRAEVDRLLNDRLAEHFDH